MEIICNRQKLAIFFEQSHHSTDGRSYTARHDKGMKQSGELRERGNFNENNVEEVEVVYACEEKREALSLSEADRS